MLPDSLKPGCKAIQTIEIAETEIRNKITTREARKILVLQKKKHDYPLVNSMARRTGEAAEEATEIEECEEGSRGLGR